MSKHTEINTEINTGAGLRRALADGAKLTEQWSGTAGSLYALVEYPDVPLSAAMDDPSTRWPRIGNDVRVLIQAVNEYAAINADLYAACEAAIEYLDSYLLYGTDAETKQVLRAALAKARGE